MSKGLYDRLHAAGCQIDNHESDLYVLDTPQAREIIEAEEHRPYYSTFTSQIDGKQWIDLPFMFLPWWRERS